ncbi:hypothetical protein [Algoriphagus sp.]|nr:hypothetical protein [Algoriphagus sp.]|tara:strand:- start:118 stop:258 length:141 start_codon:yes stop_codon:yes gene_type:complete
MKHPKSPYKQSRMLDPFWVQLFKIIAAIAVTGMTVLFLLILIITAK